MPKVSIIIPVYNVEQYLRQCLDSVINQTLKDIEIICIDDCSTDNSLAILKEYAEKDNRFIIIQQETNQGQGIARNKGLDFAGGEYIGFVDPDDWIEPNMYEELYNYAINNNADFVQCDYNRFFEESGDFKPITALRPFKKGYKNVRADNIFTYQDFREECFLGLWNLVWTRLYKKSLIDKNHSRFSEGKYGEDKAFSIECKLSAERIYYTNKILYNYRVRANSSCHKELLNVKYILDEIKNVLLKLGKEAELKDVYDKFVIYLYGEEYKSLDKYKQEAYLSELKTSLSDEQFKVFNKTVVRRLKRKEFMENIFSIKNDKLKGCKEIKLFGIKLSI